MAAGMLQISGLRPPIPASLGLRCRLVELPASAPAFLSAGNVKSPKCYPLRSSLRFTRSIGCSAKAGDRGNLNAMDSNLPGVINRASNVLLDFALTNFLPLALLSGVTLGLVNPSLGRLAHKYSLSKFSTLGIFFISGLMLQSREIAGALEAWPAGLLGLV